MSETPVLPPSTLALRVDLDLELELDAPPPDLQGQLLSELSVVRPEGEIDSLAELAASKLTVVVRPELQRSLETLLPPGLKWDQLGLRLDNYTPVAPLIARVAERRDTAAVLGEEALPLVQPWLGAR